MPQARSGTQNSERDRDIVEVHRSGMSMQEIGHRHQLSTERVRQIVRTAEGRATSRARGSSDGERVRLRIGNLAKAVLVIGQAYRARRTR